MTDHKKQIIIQNSTVDEKITEAKKKQVIEKFGTNAWKNEISMQFRVRYSETDQMGITWHGNYFSWFEMGRLEHLRHNGISYSEVSDDGYVFAVIHAECDYKKPARYDDLVTLITAISRVTPARIEHSYHLYKDDELLAVGKTVVVTLDHNGIIHRIPQWILDFCLPSSNANTSDSEKNTPKT